MLYGEELIPGGERTVDLPDVESSPFGARRQVDVRRQVREGYKRLVLREGWNRPIGRQREQARCRQSSPQGLSTGDLFRHASPPGQDVSCGDDITTGPT